MVNVAVPIGKRQHRWLEKPKRTVDACPTWKEGRDLHFLRENYDNHLRGKALFFEKNPPTEGRTIVMLDLPMLGRSRNDGLQILWIQSESNELDIVNVQGFEQAFLIPCCPQKKLVYWTYEDMCKICSRTRRFFFPLLLHVARCYFVLPYMGAPLSHARPKRE